MKTNHRKSLFTAVLATCLAAATAQAQLIHRYSFTTDGTDSVGGANATLHNLATVTGGALTLNALGSTSGTLVTSGDNTGPYATLPGTVLQGLTNMTIEFWVSAGTAATGDAGVWSRVYDFGNSINGSGQDYVIFSPHDGSATSRGTIRDALGNEYVATHYSALDDGQPHHVVMVYDAVGGWIEYYIDGALAGSGVTGRAVEPLPLSVLQTNNMYLGRSQWSGDAYLLGSIDELRIWNRALSGAEAMANQQSGPGQATIDLSSLGALSSIALTDPGYLLEKTNGFTVATGNYANFFGLNLFHLPGFTITSSDPTVATVDASGNIKTLKPGMTTLTATYGSVSATFDFYVYADTALPVLTVTDANYDRVVQVTSTKPLDPVSATALSTYKIDGGAVTISSASLSTNGLVVTLKTSVFDVTAVHSLAVTGLKDTDFTPNVVSGTYPFGSAAGSVTRKVWRTGAATIAAFQAFPTYPTHPDEVYNLPTASTPAANGDNYCDILEGYIVPDTTGNYVFAIASDDDSALYISSDATVANLNPTPIANVAGYVTAALRWTQYTSQQSSLATPQHFVAGSKYYFRAVHREGTGGDFLQVAMQLTNGLAAPEIPDNTPEIQGANLAPYFDTPVALAISSQPATNQTVIQSRPISFSIVASGIPNYTGLQWYRNGLAIAGATSPTYTMPNTPLTNDGATYYAVVSNLAYTVQSSNIVLSVTADTTPPTLVSANTRLGGTVFITFSEQLDAVSATTLANYSIAGETITNATLDASGTIVTLYVTPKITSNFGVVVNNVKDYTGNSIAPDSGVNGVVLGVTPGMVAYWPLDVLAGGKSPDLVSGFDMTAVGLVATNVVAGKWGNAIYFDGVGTLLKHTFNASDPMPIYKQAAHTISIWVNAGPNTAAMNDRRFFSESSLTANNPLYNLGTLNSGSTFSSKLVLFVRNDGGTASPDHAQSAANVYDNTWHHVCMVQTASNSPVKFYIDGVLDTLTFTPSYPMTQNTTTIGGIQRASTSAFFPGIVDDVAVWNRALDPDEVSYLATHVTPTPPVIPLPLAINTFAVSLPAVQQGGSIILSWDVSKDADTVDIQPGIGSVLGQTVLGAGTLTIPITTSTTYTLTVKRGVETKTAQVSVAAIGGVASGWTLLDNFDRYAVGNLGSPWLVPNSGLKVVDVGGNRLLEVNAGGALTGLPLGAYVVKEGSVATLFFRLYVSQALDIGQVDELIGLTDKGIRSYTDYTGDCGPSVQIQNSGGNAQIGTQNNYGNPLEFASDPMLMAGNVYNVWIDITNDVIVNNDLVTIYAAQDGSSTRTVLFQDYRSDRNPNDISILGPTGPDLNNLIVGGNTSGSLIYLDDFYLSVSNYNSTVPRVFGYTTPIASLVLPQLGITKSLSSLVISWPTSQGAGYTLQSSTDLKTWSTESTPVVINGANNTVTISTQQSSIFYRLIK